MFRKELFLLLTVCLYMDVYPPLTICFNKSKFNFWLCCTTNTNPKCNTILSTVYDISVVTMFYTHPDSRHRLDSLLVLSQRAHVRLLLEQRHIVVDIHHVDTDPSGRFLPAAVSCQHGQCEAAHQLIV